MKRCRKIYNDEYALRIAAANKRKNPDPGERSYTEQPVDAIANGIGMVHQHFKLVPSLTVYENILLGAEIKKEKGLPEEVASNEMCTFLILNISSLQLIPVSVIAYRSQYGSSNPSAITGAAIAATLVSTATAVIFCKIKEKMTKDTF